MKRLSPIFLNLFGLALAPLIFDASAATFNPVLLKPGSFNRDVVVEKTAPGPIGRATTATMDAGTNNTGDSWYETGFNAAAPATGVPVANSTFTSAAAANHQFQMAPTYATNNAVLIDAIVTNATWTLVTPAAYTNLSFLTSGGHNGRTIGVLVHHQDSTIERGSFISPDWFNGASPAYTPSGRVTVTTFAFNNVNSGNPRLYSRDLALTNKTSPVISIDLTNASVAGGNVGIFAVSGALPTAAAWSPIRVTGYNADMIVEAGAPQPVPLNTATTATLENGDANSGTTWFEAGYDPFLPTNGLPAAGAAITSANQPDHHYVMPASYLANNAVFLDAANPSASVTPASPATFSALSFLTAAANGDVATSCLVQHADGTSEATSFTSRDWINNSPITYLVNGRVNLDTRSLTNENSTPLNPRLYEAQIALANTASPVTNMVLGWSGGGSARSVIFAVCGTVGAIPAIISSSPDSILTYEGSNEVFSVTLSGGTPPFSFRWQKGTNGVYANLSDGGNISGATTTNLYVSGVGLVDSGDYRLVVSNVTGPVNSGIGTLTVLSDLPDVTVPGDPITGFGGTSPVAEDVSHAIDDDTSKYLNFGAGTTPFGGPVGLVVTPSSGRSRLRALRFYTANDFPERDPADYLLEGSNDGGASYVAIASGPLALPDGRNDIVLPVDPLSRNMQQVSFDNAASYTSYRLTFTHVKNAAGANSCQIGDVEFLGINVALSIDVSPSYVNTYAGPGTTAQFIGNVAPIDGSTTFQWQKATGAGYVSLVDGPNVSGSTTTTLTINNLTLADAGTYILVVSNSVTSGSGGPALLNVVSTMTDVTAPDDVISSFNGSSPVLEGVTNAINNTTDKYLNYGTDGDIIPPFSGPVGLVVTPAVGSTLVTAVRIYAANDVPERDPIGFKLEGSNNGGGSYSLISSNALSLPNDRNAAGSSIDPISLVNQEVRFANNQAYKTYRLTFNNVKNNSSVNSVQVGEIELLGRVPAILAITPGPGGSLTISSSLPGELQSTTALRGASTVWQDAGPISGSVIISPSPAEPVKFYRVVVP